ncbi:uncharacterized protein N7473_011171 [Penicillium subrubescens]|uniref:uncharacterized protein n=1 Tax=Penicillium subrubescens TaxID=1316194 RepID=UPI002545A52D|nr:uncharacterized protein N7473_011171 [Penicillium subrubescens]KAJ5882737.1 hypothetical protein N7473_011171 [Penicillium subrubescens]
MIETPQAGAPCTPSSSRQARCEQADDMDTQAPQQQPSPPPYPHEAIRDQSMDDGRPSNPPFQSMQNMQNIQNMQNMHNMFDPYFEYPSASQESDPIISGVENVFYQAFAQFFYARFIQNMATIDGRANVVYYFTEILRHQFPNPSPAGSNNHFMANQEMS